MKTLGISVCVLLIGMAVTPFTRASEVIQQINIPAKASLIVNESGCNNRGGPQVTLEGEIVLGEVCAKVIFSNNAKGTHTATVLREYEVKLALEKRITIPKQPVRGGVGGNPHIWLQFHDGKGHVLSQELYLGRCVQGLNVSTALINQAIFGVTVDGALCSNSKGPVITLSGDLVLGGLHAKLIFRNNLKGRHTAEATANLMLIAEGESIVLPKQPVLGGVGGNPLISFQFIDCKSGESLDDPVQLGRCNKL